MNVLPRDGRRKEAVLTQVTVHAITDSTATLELFWPKGPPPPLTLSGITTVEQNIQQLWEQTDFDFTSVSNLCLLRIAHARFLSDTKHCPMVTLETFCRTTVPECESRGLGQERNSERAVSACGQGVESSGLTNI